MDPRHKPAANAKRWNEQSLGESKSLSLSFRQVFGAIQIS